MSADAWREAMTPHEWERYAQHQANQLDTSFAHIIRALGGNPDQHPKWTRADDYDPPETDYIWAHACGHGCLCDQRADQDTERRTT